MSSEQGQGNNKQMFVVNKHESVLQVKVNKQRKPNYVTRKIRRACESCTTG